MRNLIDFNDLDCKKIGILIITVCTIIILIFLNHHTSKWIERLSMPYIDFMERLRINEQSNYNDFESIIIMQHQIIDFLIPTWRMYAMIIVNLLSPIVFICGYILSIFNDRIKALRDSLNITDRDTLIWFIISSIVSLVIGLQDWILIIEIFHYKNT